MLILHVAFILALVASLAYNDTRLSMTRRSLRRADIIFNRRKARTERLVKKIVSERCAMEVEAAGSLGGIWRLKDDGKCTASSCRLS